MAGRRHVPWWVGVSPEAVAHWAQTPIGRYYTDAGAMLRAQMTARAVFSTRFGIHSVGIGATPPAYVGAAALGAQVVFPDNHAPMVLRRAIESADEIRRLQVREPATCALMQRYVDFYHSICARLGNGDGVSLGHGQEGPITTAVLLRGSDFFTDLYDDPAAAHHLLDVVTETYIAFADYARWISGADSSSWELADDHAGNLAPHLWPQFVVPYWRRIYQAMGGTRRLHSELLRKAHLDYVHQLDIAHVDFGEDQHIRLEDALHSLHIPFSWHILSVADMMQASPEAIRRKYAACVGRGAPIMATEIYPATPETSISAFVGVAREHE